MSLIIGVLIDLFDHNKEMIFASDGRAIEYKITDSGKIHQRIKSENAGKIKKLTPKICVGYAGKNAELFNDIYEELKKQIHKMKKKNAEFFAKILRELILKILKTKTHKKIEKKLEQFGLTNNNFCVGGVFNNGLIFIKLRSKDNYKIQIYKLEPPERTYYVIPAIDEILPKVETMLDEKLPQARDSNEIVDIIKYIISKTSEMHHSINNHVFIRRLSNKFDLEK
ncbi:MAG: hypothetical protein JSV96_01660 [Candidatus Aminicenantes bacterium]|nr:MAG: hypothetical protein JSV96_01660 [Candidatus Aminicenantes bacterium]